MLGVAGVGFGLGYLAAPGGSAWSLEEAVRDTCRDGMPVVEHPKKRRGVFQHGRLTGERISVGVDPHGDSFEIRCWPVREEDRP